MFVVHIIHKDINFYSGHVCHHIQEDMTKSKLCL